MDSGQAPTTREDNKDIDVADEAGVTLYDLAYECEDLFDARLAELAELGGHRWRFAIWAEDLGVFARKSQSLDKKLENHPDLVDLVVRLLGVLRVNLAQRGYLAAHGHRSTALHTCSSNQPSHCSSAFQVYEQ